MTVRSLERICGAFIAVAAAMAILLAASDVSAMPTQAKGKKSARTQAKPAPTAVSYAAGIKIYGVQGCAACHAIAGKGGTAGPDLSATGLVPGHTAQWFRVQIDTPTKHTPSSTMPTFAGKIKAGDMTALAAYLVSLKGAAAAAPKAAAAKAAVPQTALIDKIEKAGGTVQEVAQNDPRLEVRFNLSDKPVTDASLVPLKTLKNVYELNLGRTAVTDAELAYISGQLELNFLHLENTKITDAGLALLKNLKNLVYLNLYGTPVTDAGLAHLTGLSKLKHLYVWQTKVTPAGVDTLKKALPNLEIVTGTEMEIKKPEIPTKK